MPISKKIATPIVTIHIIEMPTYFEGFGWVFIEAMAAGLPAIATRINAISEMVNHGETGFLIQPGNRRDLAFINSAICLQQRFAPALAVGWVDEGNPTFTDIVAL